MTGGASSKGYGVASRQCHLTRMQSERWYLEVDDFIMLGANPNPHNTDNITKEDRKMPETYVTKELHDESIRRIDDENDRQNARLSALEQGLKEVNKITVSIERLTANIETMTDEIKKQGIRLDEIEKKPAKRWDVVITGALSAIVGALMAAMMSGLIR